MTTARPFLMFQGGHAQAALDLYLATFPDSRMVRVERYVQGGPAPAGAIKVAVFTLCGREFMCSDSPVKHGFTFTPSSSTFVDFDSVAELERVFGVLSQGGQVLMPLANYGFSERFGWLSDRFGVSWQLNLPAK
jgi:predicted 3-demethylubiquinone-9 3-methyltransferase (glyoxalase superfamily)